MIPCHGGADDTRACVRSLQSSAAAARDLEIVIVDNASPDDTSRIGSEFRDTRVVRSNANLGFAGGVNLGVAEARADRLLVVNNDTLAGPRMLDRLEAGLDADPRIGFVAPTSNHVKGPARIDVGPLGRTETERSEIEDMLADVAGHAPLQDVATLSGLCLMFDRSVYEQLGGFDDRFGAGMFEDDDLSLRAQIEGWRLVIARTAFLFHHGHRTFERLGHDFRATIEAKLACFRDKWEPDPAGRTYLELTVGDPGRAPLHADEALARHPRWAEPHRVLADAAHRRGDFETALPHVDRFLESKPQHGPSRVLRALCTIAGGDDERGRLQLESAFSTCWFDTDDLARSLADLGRLYLLLERPADALPHLESAHELDPEHAENANLLGAALLGTGRRTRAIAVLENAARGGCVAAHNNLGICAWQVGDRERAVREFELAAAGAPTDQGFRANLSRARAALDSSATARRG
ncbi:MAG: glycosyltransferase [Planctomycetes bacterium]|nr:glycosyltransferase [Planctomycetota bacterium]